MARFDPVMERNILSKKEKVIQLLVNISLCIALANFALLLLKPVRTYQLHAFPNLHFNGMCCLFVFTLIRINQADKEGKDPYMEGSREWRGRKDMLSTYDYIGPGPAYSNKLHNIIFLTAFTSSCALIVAELIKQL